MRPPSRRADESLYNEQKKRGKRLPPPSSEDAAAKKPRKELCRSTLEGLAPGSLLTAPPSALAAYEKEVQQYESRSLKDAGSGVRSNMK